VRGATVIGLSMILLSACGSTTAARLTPSRTPSPTATPTASPTPTPTPTPTALPPPPNLPRAAGIGVPAGFAAFQYARGLYLPTAMAFGPDGRLYVTGASGTVSVVSAPGGGAQTLASGLPAALGLVWRGTDLYLSVRGSVRDYRLSGGGLARGPVVAAGIPNGRHQNDNIVLLPSGDFLLGNGSTCDLCNEADARSAAVLRFRADWSYAGVVVRGARNPYGLALRASDGQAYVTINGQDFLGNQPADHMLRVVAGENAGWPRCWPSYPDGGLHGSCAGVAPPIAVFAPHSSADGIVFYEGSDFGAGFMDNAFVTEWGNNAGSAGIGRRVMRVQLTGPVGAEHGVTSTFATGFSHPLAITVAPDGGLLVGDYGTGRIIEIFRIA